MSRRTKVCSLTALALGVALTGLLWPRPNHAAREALDELRAIIDLESETAPPTPPEPDRSKGMVETRFCIAKLCLNDATAGLFSTPGQDAKPVHGRVRSEEQAQAIVERLRTMGVLEVLSLPMMVSQSGQSAYAMTGSQILVPIIPAPVPAAVAVQNVGCKTSVSSRMLDDGMLHVELETELSWLEDGAAAVLAAVPPPGGPAAPPGGAPPKIGKASTGKIAVRIRSGETLVVAGLPSRSRAAKTLKAPLLSDLPAVGSWFSWTYERDVDEELILLMTARIVSQEPRTK
jgi:Flp pilus assembly secretin CpaC